MSWVPLFSMICLKRVLLLFAAFAIAVPLTSVAQTHRPLSEETACAQPSTRDRMAGHPGLNPSRLFRIDVGPFRYAVPWKYLHPRPGTGMPGCKIDTEVLGVQFWIPSGEAPHRDLFWKPQFNPSEPGRLHPGPEESVIKVTEIRYYDRSPQADNNTDQRIQNILEAHTSLRPEGDLVAVKTAGPNSETYAWFRQEKNKSILFKCLGSGEGRVCQGFLDLKDNKLSVHFLASGNSIQFNAAIISTLEALLKRWEVQT